MAVASYDPFTVMNQFQRDVNRLFRGRSYNRRIGESAAAPTDWVPPADVQEENGQYVISMDVPGVDVKDIEVTMEKGVLSLSGTRSTGETDKNAYKRRERPSGGFQRRFIMPDDSDAEGITAHGKNGVLQVIIPKRQKAQPRRIEVAG